MKEITYSDPARCETWKLSHNCNLNCTDCSPGMETTGTFKIFSSSKEKHGLYQTSFYGDFDNKAYHAVKDIYGSIKPIKKFEYVGHHKKRVTSRPLIEKNDKTSERKRKTD